MSYCALLLAAALLVAPSAARRRLGLTGHPVGARLLRWPCLVVAVGAAVIVLPVATVAAAALVTGAVVARRRQADRRARRRSEAAELRDALDVLVGELRVGAHPVAAFGVAAREVDGRVAESLRAVASRGHLGADVAAGLRAAARTSALPAHWERLAVCWHLAQTHGLAIATLMQAAQRDIAERERFSATFDAGLAGARATAAILAALPLFGIALGQLIGADSLGFLLSGGIGGWLLVTGVTLCRVGLWWSDRIAAGALP